MRKENILLIGPHPDDVFISCGGFVLSNLERYKFYICCMSSQGGKEYDTRILEETTAWRTVSEDIEIIFLDSGVDTKLEKSYCDIVNLIENITKDISPKIIFTPYPEDTHQDHVTVSRATMSACRYEKNVLFYDTPSTLKFHPSIFFKLKTETLNRKKELSNIYGSQVLGGSEYQASLSEIIESKALSNGVTSRVCKYAEGFSSFKFFL